MIRLLDYMVDEEKLCLYVVSRTDPVIGTVLIGAVDGSW